MSSHTLTRMFSSLRVPFVYPRDCWTRATPFDTRPNSLARWLRRYTLRPKCWRRQFW